MQTPLNSTTIHKEKWDGNIQNSLNPKDDDLREYITSKVN
jgi:hypothetical protein